MEARKSCTQLLKLHNSQPYNEEQIYYLLWMLRCLLGLPHCLYSLSHVLYCLDYDMPSEPNKPLERIQWYNRIGKVEPSFGISPSYSRKSYLVYSVLGSISNPTNILKPKISIFFHIQHCIAVGWFCTFGIVWRYSCHPCWKMKLLVFSG